MKKILILLLLAISFFFVACDSGSSIGNDDDDGALWEDSKVVTSNMDLDTLAASGVSYSSGSSRAASSEDKIYFRSSDIEFWAIQNVADIGGIASADESTTTGYTSGESLKYILGDETESVVFTPYSDYSIALGSGSNTNWGTKVSNFKSELTDASIDPVINLARLDIGFGQIIFYINGEERKVLNSDKEAANTPVTEATILEWLNDGLIDQTTYDTYIKYSGFNAQQHTSLWIKSL